MGLWDIAVNNLKRRKGKALLIIIGIALGIATVVALFSLITAMNDKVNKDLERLGTKVVLIPQTEKMSLSYGGIVVAQDVAFDIKPMPENVLSLLEANAQELNIEYILQKNVQVVDVNGRLNLLVGMNINNEFAVKPWLKVKGSFAGEEKQIILGSTIARQMAKGPGDTVLINNQELVISGILEETGQEEDNIILVPLALFEKLAGDNRPTLIEIYLTSNADVGNNLNKLRALLPDVKVITTKEMMEARKEVIERFENFAILVSVIVFVILVLIVVTTMLGAVNERTKEIGVFRAFGFRKKDIIHVISLEAALACTLGGLLGYILGIFTAKGVAPMLDYELSIGWNPVLGILMLILAIMIGLIASWFPANKAAELDPQEALRYL
ncbi:MAG: FtsX-like permease family protein [Clostridia bacterium]|nr:FtsX-like permease family protein [Clostridia bacterium]